MDKKPFFSIGIPVYNTEKYMARCIDSILCQGFTDYEIIVTDDGGSDTSIDIVRGYNDSRIKIISKPNGGLPAARNTAANFACGEYIYFLDSDDTMCPDALQNAYDGIVKNNYPDILHTGFIRVVDGKETLCPAGNPAPDFFDGCATGDERWIKMWDKHLTPNQVMTKFIKLDFLKRSGVSFSTRLFAQEDSDFTFNICRKAETMAFADFYSFRYFKNQENSMSTVWSYKSLACAFTRWHNFFYCDADFYKLGDEYRKIVEKRRVRFLEQMRDGIVALCFSRNDEELYKIIDLIEVYFGKDIRKLPLSGGSYAFLNPFYRFLGIKATVKLLRIAIKMRGKK